MALKNGNNCSKNMDPDRVVFLDRDGTLNQNYPDRPVYRLDDFKLFPYSAACIRRLNDAGVRLFLATNQGGIRHRQRDFNWETYHAIEQRMTHDLWEQAEAKLDAIYVSEYADYENHPTRKPGIGLFEKAERDHDFTRASSFMVGDSVADILAGHRFGLKTILVDSGWQKNVSAELSTLHIRPDYHCLDLPEATDYILNSVEH